MATHDPSSSTDKVDDDPAFSQLLCDAILRTGLKTDTNSSHSSAVTYIVGIKGTEIIWGLQNPWPLESELPEPDSNGKTPWIEIPFPEDADLVITQEGNAKRFKILSLRITSIAIDESLAESFKWPEEIQWPTPPRRLSCEMNAEEQSSTGIASGLLNLPSNGLRAPGTTNTT